MALPMVMSSLQIHLSPIGAGRLDPRGHYANASFTALTSRAFTVGSLVNGLIPLRVAGFLTTMNFANPANSDSQTDPTIPNSNRPALTKVAASARESVQAPEVSGLTDVFVARRP